MLHALPYHNPPVLAGAIAPPTSSPAAATSSASGAATAGSAPRRRAARRAGAPALRGGRRPAVHGARQRALLAPRDVLDVGDSHVDPFLERKFRVYLGGTSDRTYSSPPSTAGASPCRRCCRTSRSLSRSTSTARTRAACARSARCRRERRRLLRAASSAVPSVHDLRPRDAPGDLTRPRHLPLEHQPVGRRSPAAVISSPC